MEFKTKKSYRKEKLSSRELKEKVYGSPIITRHGTLNVTCKYIYAVIKNNVPVYIGCTINPDNRRRTHKTRFGHDIEFDILDKVGLDDWDFWEQHYISLYKSFGFTLENVHPGGICSIVDYDPSIGKIIAKEEEVLYHRKFI